MYKPGVVYEGVFREGKREGYGVLKQAGEVYKGHWEDDCKSGFGLLLRDGEIKYEGYWENNKFVGRKKT